MAWRNITNIIYPEHQYRETWTLLIFHLAYDDDCYNTGFDSGGNLLQHFSSIMIKTVIYSLLSHTFFIIVVCRLSPTCNPQTCKSCFNQASLSLPGSLNLTLRRKDFWEVCAWMIVVLGESKHPSPCWRFIYLQENRYTDSCLQKKVELCLSCFW